MFDACKQFFHMFFQDPLIFHLTVQPTRAEDIATYREAILSLEQDQYWSKAIDILDEAAARWSIDTRSLEEGPGPWM